MMTEDIRSDMVAAMKAKEELRLTVLRSMLTAFTNELVAKGKKPTDQLSDEDVISVLKRLAKQRKDAAEQFKAGGRDELAQREAAELLIIEEYLPEMAGREEIERVAKAKIEELGVTSKADMGKLMGAIMKEFGGNADGNDVKEVVNSLLS